MPVVVNAVRAVPEELVDTALTLSATKLGVIRTVLVPAALPEIIDSFRVMNAMSWTCVILAEVVNSNDGLGYMIEISSRHRTTSRDRASATPSSLKSTSAPVKGLTGRLRR
jgi:NitT/TauT family transport system permease protein